MGYIKFKFISAKVPIINKLEPKGKSINDHISDWSIINKKGQMLFKRREKLADYNDLIHFSQISNAIHVLLGARPAPSMRETLLKRNEKIDEIASNVLIKIDTPVSFVDKFGNNRPILEFTSGKKIPWESHSQNIVLTWSVIKRKFFYKENKYKQFISILEEISGLANISKQYELFTFLNILKQDEKKWNEYCNRIKEFECSALMLNSIDSIGKNNGKYNLAARTINTNPVDKIAIDGEIILYNVKSETINDFFSKNQYSTFLDGGLLKIIEYDNEDIDIEEQISNGFKKL